MKKKISEAEDGSRNIPININLATLTISKLSGMSFKAGKIKLKKKLSDASMSTGERVPQIFSGFFSRSLTLHQSSM